MTGPEWRPIPSHPAYWVNRAGQVLSDERIVYAMSRWGHAVARRWPSRILRPNATGWCALCDGHGGKTLVRGGRLAKQMFNNDHIGQS